MNKQTIVAALALLCSVGVQAQSGTNSPYSQYGIGLLSDQSQGFSRGMNGVGLALRKGNVANSLNPASYSAIDSLTMLFDVGVSGQITNFKEGNHRMNVKNADFEYAIGCFRLLPKVGASFGILPYSNIGYEYSTTQKLNESFGSIPVDVSGSGGLHQAYVGAGWNVIKPLSVGFNVAYLWGSINRSVASGSSVYIDSYSKAFNANVSSYLLTLGAQWDQPINANDHLLLGLTVGVGHKLKSDVTISNGDSTVFSSAKGLELPMTYGLGLGWTHGSKLFLGADVTMQRWGSVDFPGTTTQGSEKVYALRKGLLKDGYTVKVGFDYVPSATSRTFINRVHYRFGMGYATPYYYINGKEGPKEFSVSGGFGIPLDRIYWNSQGNMRPVLNVSAQWVHTSAKDLITENTFRINLGLTFNERWFAKWKVN